MLSWNRVRAARYEVQLSSSSSFSPILYSTSTTNRRATPTTTLPQSELYWRVRGVSSTGVPGSWAQASFTKALIAGPALAAPADGEEFRQPDEPVLLSWAPVRGAIGYSIEIDDDGEFITPNGSYTARSTTYLVPNAGLDQTYHWRVRANFSGGFNSLWSGSTPVAPRTFVVRGLAAPVLTSPDDSATTQVTDAVLDWAPVNGAVDYEVQVSTDREFNTFDDKVVVKSTSYAQPTTLNNDQYWWRVRAIDARDNRSPWTESVNQFQRHWPQRPTLIYPTNSSSVDNPFYYEWSPVKHASHYELQVGDDPNFSPGSYSSTQTKATTYTIRFGGDVARPGIGGLTYWRVRALDSPLSPAVNGIWSTIQSFSFQPGQVQLLSPATGTEVHVPTLRWSRFEEAEAYRVTVKKASGATAVQSTTFATTWTPNGTQRLNPADGPFSWTVEALDDQSRVISQPPLFDTHSFDVSGEVIDTGAPALQPTGPINGAQSSRFPELTWEPYFAGDGTPAAYYKVFVGPGGTGSFYTLGDNFPYSSATDDTDQFLTPGDWDWFVRPYNSSGAPLAAPGPTRTFVITNLDNVSGHGASLTGTGLASPTTTCEHYLDNPTETQRICGGMLQTPVLEWDSVPQAAFYMVYVSRDRQLTNLIYNPLTNPRAVTSNTIWTPTELLPDSQAGDAYYWVIRPCKATGYCAPDPLEATHAFDKRSVPVLGLTMREHDSDPPITASPAVFADEIVLSWTDYLATNQATTDQTTGLSSTVEARSYRVDISSDPNFASNAAFKHTSSLLDQTSYTAYADTLPEGPLWWRVQALDGSGNALTYSVTKALEKRSPVPQRISPAKDSTVSGMPYFEWAPLAYAEAYDIEVYKNGDTTFSPANRVITGRSGQAAFTTDVALSPDDSPYVWRVRRLDSTFKVGDWSPVNKSTGLGVFNVRGAPPALVTPKAGAYVSARDTYFSWRAVAGAASYRFERRVKGAASPTETVATVGLAWAPTGVLADGAYEWRVAALNGANGVIGTSPWREFRVDATAPTVVRKSPLRTASRTANFVANFSEPMKKVNTTTMALFVKGQQHRLSATVRMSNGGKTATLNPAVNLRVGRTYTLRLLNGITDRAGNPLPALSWTVTAK